MNSKRLIKRKRKKYLSNSLFRFISSAMMTVIIGKIETRFCSISYVTVPGRWQKTKKKKKKYARGLLHRDSFTSELALQMHIVRLWLESEMLFFFLSTHQCWVSCISEQPSKNDREPIKASLLCHDVSVFCKTS